MNEEIKLIKIAAALGNEEALQMVKVGANSFKDTLDSFFNAPQRKANHPSSTPKEQLEDYRRGQLKEQGKTNIMGQDPNPHTSPNPAGLDKGENFAPGKPKGKSAPMNYEGNTQGENFGKGPSSAQVGQTIPQGGEDVSGNAVKRLLAEGGNPNLGIKTTGQRMEYNGNTQGENFGNGLSAGKVNASIPQGGESPIPTDSDVKQRMGKALLDAQTNNPGDQLARDAMGRALKEQNPVAERLQLAGRPNISFNPNSREQLIDTDLGGNNLEFTNPATGDVSFADRLRWALGDKKDEFLKAVGGVGDKIDSGVDSITDPISNGLFQAQEWANANPIAATLGAGGLGLGALGALGAGAYRSLRRPQPKTAGVENTDNKGEKNMNVNMNLVKTAAILGNKNAIESLEKVGYFNMQREVAEPNLVDDASQRLNYLYTNSLQDQLGDAQDKVQGAVDTAKSVGSGIGNVFDKNLGITDRIQGAIDTTKDIGTGIDDVLTKNFSSGGGFGGIDPQTAAMLGLGAAGLGAAGYGAHKLMNRQPKMASAPNPYKETVEGVLKLAQAGVAEAYDFLVKMETLMPGLADEIIK